MPRYGQDDNEAFPEPESHRLGSLPVGAEIRTAPVSARAGRRLVCGYGSGRSEGRSRKSEEPIELSYVTSPEGPSFRVSFVSGPLAVFRKGNRHAKIVSGAVVASRTMFDRRIRGLA